jgi:hypothetical protein
MCGLIRITRFEWSTKSISSVLFERSRSFYFSIFQTVIFKLPIPIIHRISISNPSWEIADPVFNILTQHAESLRLPNQNQRENKPKDRHLLGPGQTPQDAINSLISLFK